MKTLHGKVSINFVDKINFCQQNVEPKLFFKYRSLSKTCGIWARSSFGPHGYTLNKLCRGSLDDAKT